jgi:hypothetical protein
MKLEFFEHHFAKVGHRLAPYDPTLSLTPLLPTPHTRKRLPQSGFVQTLVLYRKRTGATASVSLDLRSSLSIQPFEGGRFVRGGRYGISIDFGSEVVEKKKSICGASFKSKFIDLTVKPRLTIASS